MLEANEFIAAVTKIVLGGKLFVAVRQTARLWTQASCLPEHHVVAARRVGVGPAIG